MKAVCAAAGAALILFLAAQVTAAPLKTANVGDPMASLVAGLEEFPLSPAPCPGVSVSTWMFGYVRPGRPHDLDHASVVALRHPPDIVLAVTFDEDDLDTPVTVYADESGGGTVTHVWPVAEAPLPCQIVHHRYGGMESWPGDIMAPAPSI